jgi:hypothetical protein
MPKKYTPQYCTDPDGTRTRNLCQSLEYEYSPESNALPLLMKVSSDVGREERLTYGHQAATFKHKTPLFKVLQLLAKWAQTKSAASN